MATGVLATTADHGELYRGIPGGTIWPLLRQLDCLRSGLHALGHHNLAGRWLRVWQIPVSAAWFPVRTGIGDCDSAVRGLHDPTLFAACTNRVDQHRPG